MSNNLAAMATCHAPQLFTYPQVRALPEVR